MVLSVWYHVFYIGFLGYFIIPVINSESVFMDKWSHCEGNDIDVDGDIYTIFATGGGFNHETLICDITFKTKHDNGLCLTFTTFSIEDCGVVLKIFERSTSSGKNMNKFECGDLKPSRICTTERYLTLKLEKIALNNNKNYNFEIVIQESNSITTGEGVFFMSIGLFAGIICAVILLIALLAALVICCCCKKKASSSSSSYKAAETSPLPPYPVQPSAPPLVDNPSAGFPPYTAPTNQPPPYSHHDPYAVQTH